jgi:aerobic carbon-monoxide dehydrogenase medium subunit
MIPAAFDYLRATTVDDVTAALAEHGDDAKVLAGGMSLLPLMKLRLATPAVLVDVARVPDLSYIRDTGDELTIGALTRHRDLETSDVLAEHCGVLRAVAAQVGDNQVRHRGTIGGSVAHGDPASDLPAALLALDELLTEIHVPKTGPTGFSYQKFNRRAQDWAIVGAVAVTNGTTRVGLVNMASTPQRATAVEAALAAGASIDDAAEHAADATEAPADLNASPEYREHLARVLVRRALTEAQA